MKRIVIYLCAGLVSLSATQAAYADCFADYKAKQESPLRLHYGVIEVDVQPCRMSPAVSDTVARRVAAGGWML